MRQIYSQRLCQGHQTNNEDGQLKPAHQSHAEFSFLKLIRPGEHGEKIDDQPDCNAQQDPVFNHFRSPARKRT